jgi:hypothetical protein
MRWSIVFGALMAVLGISTGVAAQEIIYQQRTVIDFGDDTIDGSLSKPDGQYLESRKKLRHQRLIKVRENFRTEVLQSVRALR